MLTDLFTRLPPVILQSRYATTTFSPLPTEQRKLITSTSRSIYIMYDRSRMILKTNIGLCILEVIIAGVILALYFGNSTRKSTISQICRRISA